MICKRKLGFMQTIDRELSLEYKNDVDLLETEW